MNNIEHIISEWIGVIILAGLALCVLVSNEIYKYNQRHEAKLQARQQGRGQ